MPARRSNRRPMHSHDAAAAAAAWRSEQSDVDADIEGLARDLEAARMVAELDASGVPIERQIERLKTYFKTRRDGQPPRP